MFHITIGRNNQKKSSINHHRFCCIIFISVVYNIQYYNIFFRKKKPIQSYSTLVENIFYHAQFTAAESIII